MKTDSLFYQLFQLFPGTLFELLGQSADNARGYQFSSVEIKQPTFRIDGVLRPEIDSPEATIYFEETQMQLDEEFYWRFYSEIFLYLKQEKPAANWHAIVLFASRSQDPGIPQQFAVLTSLLSVLYLDDIEKMRGQTPGFEILKLIVESKERAKEHASGLVRKLGEEPGGLQGNRRIIELVVTVLTYKFPEMTREEFEAMYQLQDLKQSAFYQEALQEGELKGKREGVQEGVRKGERKGKREGKREGKLEAVPLLVKAGVSIETIAKDLGLEVDLVQKAARKRARKAK